MLHRDINNDFFTGITDKNIGYEDDFTITYSQFGSWSTKFLEQPDYYSNNKYLFRIIPYLSGESRLAPDNTERYIEWEQSNDFTTETKEQITGFNLNGSRVGGVDSTELTHHPTDAARQPFFRGFYNSAGSAWNIIAGNYADQNWGGIIAGAQYQGGLTFLDNDYTSSSYSSVHAREMYIWKGPKP